MQSEDVNELAAALAKVQAGLEGAKKDSENPYYKSQYADLESIWSAVRPFMEPNGLAVTQTLGFQPTAEGLITTLISTLMHTSGQWISGEMPMFLKSQDPQGQGSAISYARRYCLAAILGVYQIDDDAKQASKLPSKPLTEPTGVINEKYWEKLKHLGLKNKWTEGYMRQWLKENEGNMPPVDLYDEATKKFSQLNTAAKE